MLTVELYRLYLALCT